jgi:iron complex transport system ATP-binding protein
MLALSGVAARVSGRLIVSGVSFDVQAGQVLGIVGPNGAGKTTLLRVLNGELAASQGEVLLRGRPLSDYSDRELAHRRGYLAQRSGLEFAFSVVEVVLLGRTPHLGRTSGARNLEIAERAMDLTGVSHLADRWYTELSGGERQRVQLARVLAQILDADEPLLILDEPTASLDLHHQHLTLRCVREVAARGAAVIVVLHDLALAGQYTDRVLVLESGRVLARGAPGTVLDPETVRRAFGVTAHRVCIDELGLSLVVASGPDERRDDSAAEQERGTGT